MSDSDPVMPVGFRFVPSDEELVGCILQHLLVRKQPLPPLYKKFIHASNLFGNQLEPSQIWERYGGDNLDRQDLYFFSKLKRLTARRLNRSVGSGGTWKEKEIAKPVKMDGNPNPIGRKRKFCYVNEKSKDHEDWRLDEYSVFKQDRSNDHHDNGYDFDFVICRLRKNDRFGAKKAKREHPRLIEAPIVEDPPRIEAQKMEEQQPRIEAQNIDVTNKIEGDDERKRLMTMLNDQVGYGGPAAGDDINNTVFLREELFPEDLEATPSTFEMGGTDGGAEVAWNPSNENVGNQLPPDH